MQIHFAEPIALDASRASPGFQAFGQRFTLELAGNDRVAAGLSAARKAELGHVRVLRGRVAGRAGSWVRLVAAAGRVTGAFWDGQDFYVVASHRDIASHLVEPLDVAPDQTVVFRLSDASQVLPRGYCALDGTASATRKNGLEQFNGLISELKLQFVAAPTDQIDISLIADAALQQVYGGASSTALNTAMLNAINIVDGIYDAQLGLIVTASDFHMAPASPNPFTETDPEDLLGELSVYRDSVPVVRSRAIAHLLTRRQLGDGGTLGIATLDGACDATEGVSLTSVGTSGIDVSTPLIVAHEIAHNLGARHDDASCGDTFLMWPEYSYLTQPRFSQCSLAQMRPFIAAHRGTCITSPSYGDAEARIGTISNPIRTEAFDWPVYLRSSGTADLIDAQVLINIPVNVTVNSAVPTSGSCAPFMGELRCQFGTVAAGTEARVDLDLTAPHMGPLQIRAIADATNDRYDTNNLVTSQVTVQPLAILSVQVSPASRTAVVGDTVSYTFTVTSSGPRAARDVSVNLGGGAYFRTLTANPSQGSCTVSFASASCQLGDIATGSSAQIVLEGSAAQAQTLNISAYVNSSNAYMDDVDASATLTASARRDLALSVAGGLRYAVVGAPYDLAFSIRNAALDPIADGRFRMNSGGVTVQSVTIDGVSCAPPDYFAALGGGCPLGTLQSGDERQVVVRLLFESARSSSIMLMAELPNGDDLGSNNQVPVPIEARSGVDVGIAPRVVDARIEGQVLLVRADIHSLGTFDAANISATLDVPVGLRVNSATLPQGTCSVVNDRRVTCTLPALARNTSALMSVDVLGEAPAWHTGTFSVTSPGDGASSNDTGNATIVVRPLADVSVTAPSSPMGPVVVSRPVDVTYVVNTGSLRPVQAVLVSFPHSPPGIILDSLSAPGYTCTVGATQGQCSLGDLPPGATVQVTGRYSTANGLSGMSGWVRVEGALDVNGANDIAGISINTYPAGDAEVLVASSSATGTAGGLLALPRITVNTLARISGLRLEIAVPSFAAVETVSMAGGVCSGTSTLTCDIGERDAGASDVIDITLRLNSPGTASSGLTVRAINDTHGTNDAVSVSLTANQAPPPSGSSSGGGGGSSGGGSSGGGSTGGGGGSFEWLSLAALSILLRRRFMIRPN